MISGNLGRASVLRPGMYCYPGGSSTLSVQSLKICTLNAPKFQDRMMAQVIVDLKRANNFD